MTAIDTPDPVTPAARGAPSHRPRDAADDGRRASSSGWRSRWAGNAEAADLAWTIPSVIIAVRLTWGILRDLAHGELGVDLIAILAIAGALLLARAVRRRGHRGHARDRRGARALRAGTRPARADRAAGSGATHRRATRGRRARDDPDRGVEPGDLLAIRPGEVVPVDGMVGGRPGGARRVGAHRRVAPGDARGRRARSPRGRSTRGRRSTCARRRPRPTAPTPASSASWRRRSTARRRSSASRTGTP